MEILGKIPEGWSEMDETERINHIIGEVFTRAGDFREEMKKTVRTYLAVPESKQFSPSRLKDMLRKTNEEMGILSRTDELKEVVQGPLFALGVSFDVFAKALKKKEVDEFEAVMSELLDN